MKQLRVLSLFDGMSCGQLAISRLGFNYEYYASEIDKHAIAVTMSNFPDTTQLGSVEHWQLWDIDFASIDVLIGGSPCQGFSFAGKQLNFDDPRSKLFFVYVDILNYIRSVNPNVKFLLENVKMKKEYEAVISEQLGVQPIEINSNLVSAQNRKRLYWTNIRGVTQPEDRGIYLKDIITDGHVEKPKAWTMLQSYNRFPKATESAKGRYKRCMMPIVFSTEDCLFNKGWRPINRIEGERLQTVPDSYTREVSESTALGLLGNGWTVEVIKHILKNLEV